MAFIHLPQIFQDHMILQRDKPLHIWGSAKACSHITVVLNDCAQTATVENGQFSVTLPPQPAGRNCALLLYADYCASPDIVLSDISIGDVWMACGQSNMEYFLRYDAHWNDTKKLPPNSDIRMYNCPRIAFEGQKRAQEECGRWFSEGDPAWPLFSAPGYAFARDLQPRLQVPVGIIGCNWGGTPACAWMDEETLKHPPLHIFLKEYLQACADVSPDFLYNYSMECWKYEDSYRHQLEWRAVMYGLTSTEQKLWLQEHKNDPVLPMGPYHHYRPAGLYHTMIQKIAPFSVKGFLWYQGESDADHAEIYDQTLSALISCFRRVWKDEELPFLFVQLAPFRKWLNCTGEGFEIVRQRQETVSKTVPKTGMISVMDLGDEYDIHPKFKMEVGRRLALLARGKVYGETLLCESPEFSAASLKDRQIIFSFHHARGGLIGDIHSRDAFVITQGNQLLGIEACVLSGEQLILLLDHSPQDLPLHIAFAMQDYCPVHIWNKAGLPLKPFSCDLPSGA